MRRGLTLARRGIVLVVAFALVFGVGWWAGRAALQPPRDPLVEPKVVTYEVQLGEVSRELNLSANAAWQTTAPILSGAGGTVTSVDVAAGSSVSEGASLLTIGLQPVLIAQGAVPMFRSLQAGLTGADVAQLQAFLHRQGFGDGDTDGSFGSGTAEAVRSWQRARKAPVTGVVELGSLVFTPTTPVRVRPSVTVGQLVSPGESLGDALAPAPRFAIPVTDTQLGLIPPSAPVTLTQATGVWQAVTAGVDSSDPAGPSLVLAGVDDQPVCADTCDQVPTTMGSTWSAVITIVPRVDGPVVPVAAISTAADASTHVTSEQGEDLPVSVLASADGLAVVAGIDAGQVVQLPQETR